MLHATFRNLDLNLLVTLDALLQERNVSRAARRVGVTQPAVSAALNRLRRHFGDELLHRNGRSYELTPLAELLATRTTGALIGVQRVFDAAPDFDPTTAEREFTVMLSDYATAVFGDGLATYIADRAPGVRLQLREVNAYAVSHAAETLRSIDGLVLPHGFLQDIPADDLWDDTWVCVVARDNPAVADTLTLAQVADMPWVVSYNDATAFTPAMQQLRTIGVEPDIRVVVESFLALPFLVADTNRVALVQGRLARRLADAAAVRILACPWEVVPLVEAFWWHSSLTGDPAHTWLRAALREASARLVHRSQ
ncbi:MAG: LysR family transcriptional regulator [Actinobacteria bacterium]|nr:LysR family transcriptional regulator [Actinomycetota bacterium]